MSQPHAMEMRRPSLKERQRQLREDAILDAAEELLFTKGLGSMTLEELSVEVGISKPTLYQHFRSKDELVAAIMTRGINSAERKLVEFSESMPPAQALRTLIEWFVEKRAKNDCGPVADLCLTLSQMAQSPIREAEQGLCQEIERLVAQAQADGSIHPGVPPMFISQTLMSISKDRSFCDMLTHGRTDVVTMKNAMVQMLLGSIG